MPKPTEILGDIRTQLLISIQKTHNPLVFEGILEQNNDDLVTIPETSDVLSKEQSFLCPSTVLGAGPGKLVTELKDKTS